MMIDLKGCATIIALLMVAGFIFYSTVAYWL